MIPLAEDEAKIRLEATLGYRWNPKGEQPEIEDGGRRYESCSLYGTVHLGTGEDFTIVSDWQNSEWTIMFLEYLQQEYPGEDTIILLFWDKGPYHTSAAVQDYILEHPRLQVIPFPSRTPEWNPKEPTWKTMREEKTHNHWYDSLDHLRDALSEYYEDLKHDVSDFLAKFGFGWKDHFLFPLEQL